MSAREDTLCETRGLVKQFPGVRALDGVDLRLRAGRVHALLGENGAGKSTLVGILTGNQRPDSGTVVLAGREVVFASPHEALAAGVTAVYQELTVLPAMSVADNVLLGHERSRRALLDRRGAAGRVTQALREVGLGDLDPATPCERLSLANRQLVEIARALVRGARVVILDEPSAVLSGEKLEALHAVVRLLAQRGAAVVYITHLLEEVAVLADDVTVLRDGATVATGDVAQFGTDAIITAMVGRSVASTFSPLDPPAERVVLDVRDVVPRTSGRPPAPVTFQVRAGEVVGLAGLVGSGRTRLLQALAGDRPLAAGTVEVGGTDAGSSMRARRRAGIALVPEERKSDGLVLDVDVATNASLTVPRAVSRWGVLSRRAQDRVFESARTSLGIKVSGPRQVARQLSGGNQQKVVIAKWVQTAPRALLLDEPTRGVDVGAKSEIYRIIAAMAADGLAVVVASSDLLEVMGLCHRVLVLRGGAVAGEVPGGLGGEEAVMRLALGTA